MHKTFLIFLREYTTRVRKRSFIVLTLLVPFLLVALTFVPVLLARFNEAPPEEIVVTAPGVIDHNVSDQPHNISPNPHKLSPQPPSAPPQRISPSSQSRAEASKLPAISPALTFIVGLLFMTCIYIFMLTYGSMIMHSVMEEKTNRIVEVIISSVRPIQLMMGKLLGVFFVGLTQIFIWGLLLGAALLGAGLLLPLFLNSGLASNFSTAFSANTAQLPLTPITRTSLADIPELSSVLQLPLFEMGLFFLLFFVGAYFLYASFYAAIGASVNSQEESTQFVTPMVLVMIFGLYIAIAAGENPDGSLSFWASFFPLTAPMVMMMRIPHGVPLWQELLSLLLLYAAAIAMVWAAAKVYRVGILMYGKKPKLGEMLRWIRQS